MNVERLLAEAEAVADRRRLGELLRQAVELGQEGERWRADLAAARRLLRFRRQVEGLLALERARADEDLPERWMHYREQVTEVEREIEDLQRRATEREKGPEHGTEADS